MVHGVGGGPALRAALWDGRVAVGLLALRTLRSCPCIGVDPICALLPRPTGASLCVSCQLVYRARDLTCSEAEQEAEGVWEDLRMLRMLHAAAGPARTTASHAGGPHSLTARTF